MIREVDDLQLYFGEDYVINDKISIHQPTIGEIMKIGEQEYYATIHTICAIPSDMKSILSDLGIDYGVITDFDFFTLIANNASPKITKMLFQTFTLDELELGQNTENGETVLYNDEKGIVIDRIIYQMIVDYLRKLHGITPKVEYAGNELTRKVLIEEDRQKRKLSTEKPYKSQLRSLISSMVNSEGFKYNAQQVRDVGLYEFMDSVKRIAAIRSANSLLSGCYSGNIDTKKIDKKELNWMRDLD